MKRNTLTSENSTPRPLIELFRNVFLVPGENGARFPYCNGLYLKGREVRLLIDAGMGRAAVEACREAGVDLVLLSHCHIDHRLTIPLLNGVPVWAHETEAPFLGDRDLFVEALGFRRGGFDAAGLFRDFPIPTVEVQQTLHHGQLLDLGGLTVEVLHTPGHSPGHLSFFIPEAGLLFSADIDLTPFGPFYGHDFARIDDFIASIRRLRGRTAAVLASGHGGPFFDALAERFSAYEQVIYDRDQRVLQCLDKPRPLAGLVNRNLFYPHYPEPEALIRWFEQVHLEKQLARLIALGRVREEGGLFRRV